MYSSAEYVDMLLIYGEARQNSYQAQRLYQERYPERRQPTGMTFRSVERRLRDTASLGRIRPVRDHPVTSAHNEEVVFDAIRRNPHTSTRAIAQETNISRASVMRILHTHRFHPYHLHLHHELHGHDFDARVAFCRWALQHVDTDPAFLATILFTDEARFHNNGTVNRHNMHYWSVDNPHWVRQTAFQVQWGVNVWCGIMGDHLIGPHFFEGHLTGNRYLRFLQDELPPFLEHVPLLDRCRMWFQHDGAPPHAAVVVRNHLHATYPDKWIGRGGPIPWPARSPDLTPLDFFLWGHVKQLVYAQEPATPGHLRQLITEACRSVSPEMLQRARRSLQHRAQLCIDHGGRQFEQVLR